MPLNVRFVPIVTWPGAITPPSHRERSRFRATYAKTLCQLDVELGRIDAKNALVQAWFRADQIRNDGWPYARATPRDVGVVLSFTRRGQVVSMPCDRFDTFEDNLRAIALSLEALRMVDRYGVTRNGEQYKGFTALPAADGEAGADVELAAAIALLTEFGREIGITEQDLRKDAANLQAAYRAGARKAHPDLGGSADSFGRLRRAYALVARGCYGLEVS